MDNIYNKFSLVDFLAYLLPGMYLLLVVLSGIHLLKPEFLMLRMNHAELPTAIVWLGSIAFLALAYLFGCFSSSFVLEIEAFLRRLAGKLTRKNYGEEEKDLRLKMKELLEDQFQLRSAGDYPEYIGRSIAYERTPACAPLLARQSSVRQLRRNCVVPTALLVLMLGYLSVQYCAPFYYVSLAFAVLLLRQLVISSHSNRVSEMRETYTALLALCTRD
jgi:hypothetical protein